MLSNIYTGIPRVFSDFRPEDYSPDQLIDLPVDGESSHWDWKTFPALLYSAKPLQIATFGRIQIAVSLIELGCQIDGADAKSWTALSFAAAYGNIKMVKLLLASGANVNMIDTLGRSPSIIAAKNSHAGTLEVLIQGGADLTTRDYWNRSTYQYAAEARELNALALLINTTTGWNLGAESADGLSILTSALRYAKSPHMISFLLNLGADPDTYLPRRSNILTATVVSNRPAVKMVLRRVPKGLIPKLLSHQDYLHGTPLYAAATRWSKSINMLLEAGADLELEGGHHGTPLMGACAFGRLEAVKTLVRSGARICYSKDGEVFSALCKARHFPAITRWLLVDRFREGAKLFMAGPSQ